jgi:hypothetical protein
MLAIALVSLLAAGPADGAELGGVVITGEQPVEVILYRGADRVASARTDAFGHYVVRCEPGEYWLQITVAGRETQVERVQVAPGAWEKNVALDPTPSRRLRP